MILFYEVANEADTTPMAAGYPIFREALADALLANPAVLDADDAALQILAESLANLAMLAVLGRERFRGTATAPAEASAFRDGVRATAASLGFDVGQVRFTEGGFVPR